ncbi:18808_t:CDS:10 [Acaulospora morrowiae]|uniref:DNA mismatch repair protein MSH5 n=1 Tax=Acaulospora morrowiae TaxID=94023 RepID=A0A9N8V7M7_9GLOM|nr:18808_t:CDS:10 [Acaulospora morrowiae]
MTSEHIESSGSRPMESNSFPNSQINSIDVENDKQNQYFDKEKIMNDEARGSSNDIENVDLMEDIVSTPITQPKCLIDSSSNSDSLHQHQPTSSRSFYETRDSTPSWGVRSQSNFSLNRHQLTDKESREDVSHGVTQENDVQSEDKEHSTVVDDEIGDEIVEKVIMAVNHRKRKLGCAYYNVSTSILYLMEDMEASQPNDIVNLLLYQIMPSVIIVSSRADESFIQILQSQDDTNTVQCEVEIRPGVEFVHASAKTKLCSIRLGSQQSEANRQDIYLQLSSIVNMESVETVCCAGALISYISRGNSTIDGLQDSHQFMEVLGIEQFSLSQFMHVNGDTLCSLQIFEDESHPNMHMQARSKEGLSLFGILNNTRTSTGKQLLKQWFLRPTLDLSILDERFHTIECFLQPYNLDVSDQLISSLKHIKNIPKIIGRMKGKLNVKDWQSLLQFAFYCLKIRNLVKELRFDDDIKIFTRIKEEFIVTDLKDLGSYINDVIDFDESVKENRIVIKPHVDEELDHMKRTYDGLDDFLSEVAREISAIIPTEFASTLNVIYFPQLGYLITVPLKPEWKVEKDFQIDGLYYQFSTATTVYYKNDRMRELDEYLGDIHGLIVDREIEMVQKLQDRALEYVPLLLTSSAICSELDCLLSLSESARRYRYCRPFITDANILKIEKGRHPLQELCIDVFVENDTNLAGGLGVRDDDICEDSVENSKSLRMDDDHDSYNSIMLLSGANYSGKSVYLKQVALITYMAHIGSFVPAKSATIGLTDKIFTRVQTRETISRIQSAFMIDLQQISIALRNSTSRSLLIFDEFGKGTGSTGTDGAGLFCGVMEHLLKRGKNCPKVIAATHFHEIFENNILSDRLPISLVTMEIVRNDDDEELTFLYRLVPGRSISSWGTFCASIAGVPPGIVQRATHLSQLFSRYESIPPPLDDDQERRVYATCEQVARKFLELDLEKRETDVSKFLEWVSRECG